ncbi:MULTISPECIES: SufE family protein [Thermus]|jgi:cysteine desulfuration protein SufE|uniref:Cysteine desulfurization protein SufE n=1 Tax=Thermus brockianus TaxID=56956 RepID=A0A1J0LRU0_THEBO|nr:MULTISPECIES: SufE family protein [Thermus]APD08443.1 iron-sulfur cluster biosynthesis protein SufE [Thermus brockianus]KHG66267.1 cysteine desufuration protein SufE [Thermus sp. 2.9]BDG16208.1 cysteine desulfurization protein SufE [Thermus brockianus]
MLPSKLQAALDLIRSLPKELKTEVLLDYAKKVPPPPQGVELERVHECQTPFFLKAEVEGGKVRLHFMVPDEAPTVKAFAGILKEGLEGEPPEAVLAVPPSFYRGAGLEEILTPLRLRGLEAALLRLQEQVRRAL